jgi:polysaccharide pyruvyl transferase WcaK-like protein
MKKILIINSPGLHNLGGMAIVFGTIKSLEASFKEAKLTFVSSHYENEREFYKNNFQEVQLIPHFWYIENKSLYFSYILTSVKFLNLFVLCVFSRYFNFIKTPYSDYDIIVDLNSDALNEHYGLVQPTFSLMNICLPMICKKPVVIAASSIGTFDHYLLKFFAKKILNRTSLILAREKRTLKYLIEDISISEKKVQLVGDHAFLMTPANSHRIEQILEAEKINSLKKPIVGISPSELMHRYCLKNISATSDRYEAYKQLIIDIINYMVEELNVSVLIIPHSYQESEDDRIISTKVFEEVNNKEKVILLEQKYDCTELKGLIGKCEMFIGCRMHSTIASVSMCVPTVALVYGHKSHGILGMSLGLEDILIPMENYESYEKLLEECRSKVNYVWNNKEPIKRKLTNKLPEVKRAALKNGQLIETVAIR